jgi:hypothetical protein
VRTVSVALAAHLASGELTIATCWKVTLEDASVRTFTDHDRDITFSGDIYLAATGYRRTDIQTSSALNVDNLEVGGRLVSPSITEEDLLAGLWDNAEIEVFQVNWADLTQGRVYQRVGKIGEVTLSRGTFKAELRGLMQAYTNNVGEVRTPSCRATLGDGRCKKNLAAFTVTGTIEGVNDDGVTFYDSARAEVGPAATVAITGITNANPCVVTMADASLALTPNTSVVISGVVGPVALNTATVARNPSGSTFELAVDTSNTGDFPAYGGGGTVTLMGATSGYFDYGKMIMTSGASIGIAQDVKSSVVGQWTLQLPFPRGVEVGDSYTMIAGCDKSGPTCVTKFSNKVNFRGEDKLPGIDKIIQPGRHG